MRYKLLVKHILLVSLLLVGLTVSVAKSADPVEALKTCARITDPNARLACYDSLGKSVLGEEPASVLGEEPADVPPPTEIADQLETAQPPGTASSTSLPDDIGGAEFENRSQKAPNRGLITSCKKGADNRWYFFFESGQVWKESNTGRRRFRECNFVATISKDGFGYRMQLDGETRKIRVNRVR